MDVWEQMIMDQTYKLYNKVKILSNLIIRQNLSVSYRTLLTGLLSQIKLLYQLARKPPFDQNQLTKAQRSETQLAYRMRHPFNRDH
jgi:hypothetical protein